MSPKISIIIPATRQIDSLKRLLDSINKSDFKDLEIIVVNDSKNSYQEELKNYDLTLIDNNVNQGLAFTRNQGAKIAKGEYVLFVDDDNVLNSQTISYLVDSFASQKNLIAVSPVAYYLSAPEKIWFLGAKMNLTTSKPFFYKKPEKDKMIGENLFVVENLHNCFMIRKDFGVKAGWFDKEMTMSGTELDLFLRIKEQNPDCFLAVNLDAKCYHDIPVAKKDFLRNLGFNYPQRAYFFQRNRAIIIAKHAKLWQKILFITLFYPFFTVSYLAIFLLNKRLDLVSNHLKGTRDGYYYFSKNL